MNANRPELWVLGPDTGRRRLFNKITPRKNRDFDQIIPRFYFPAFGAIVASFSERFIKMSFRMPTALQIFYVCEWVCRFVCASQCKTYCGCVFECVSNCDFYIREEPREPFLISM